MSEPMASRERSASDFKPQHFRWQVETDARVGVITIDRPERKNPLTFESYDELTRLFEHLAFAGDVRTVVVTGAGDNFCSGGDVHEIIGPLLAMKMPGLLKFTRMTGGLILAMRRCPQPIIAAVDGVCAGAGAMIALASDIRFASTAAKTAFLFTRVGLAGCDMGACTLLPRLIGQGRASELLYSGRSFAADEGLASGYYNRVVARESLLSTTLDYARSLAAGPTFGHAMTKTMLHQEWSMTIEQAIEAEAQAQAICMQTEDFQRAYDAFAAKQTPVFAGN